MPSRQEPNTSFLRGPRRFATTQWSLVLRAGKASAGEAARALGELCQQYWPPVYAYLRRAGHSPDAAAELTQEFFCRLLERGLGSPSPQKGRFRTYLLGALKHFLANQRRRARARKRGGGQAVVSLDAAAAEERLGAEPIERVAPERLYERQWAQSLLERVRQMLAAEYRSAGKAEQYEKLSAFLTGEAPAGTYAELARQWGTSEAALKVAVHRLRQQFGRRLRELVAQTVASPQEVDEEIAALREALRGG